jgi:hypothetical protein
MKDELVGSVARGVVVLTMAVAFVGCGGAATVTSPPANATPTPTPTLYLAPTDSPTPTAESTPTAETGSSATPTSKAKSTATPTAAASATPTASGSAGPTFSAAAAGCTGTAEHKAFFDSAAAALGFDVYCGALPSDWWLQSAQYSGNQLTASYANSKGWTVSLGEGNFCPGLPSCLTSTSSLGSASFGSLSGSLKLISAGTYGVFVNAGTTHGYRMIGKGMTQAQFKAWAAALVKIPKA